MPTSKLDDLLNLMYHGGLRFYHRLIQTFTTPNNAGPNDPRIVRSSVIPPELLTWAAANSVTLYVVDIWYFDATHYEWEGIGTFFGLTAKFWGTYDPTNGVYVIQRIIIDLGGGGGAGSIFLRVGSNALDTFALKYEFQQTDVTIDGSLSIGIDQPFNIDGVSQGRGLKALVDSTANSAAVGAETVVLTTPAMDFVDGRAYKCTWRGQTAASVALTFQGRVRRTNVAGQLLSIFQHVFPAGNSDTYMDEFHIVRTAGSTLNSALALTYQASAGTVTMAGSATNVRYLKCEDVGAATDYPNAIAIV